MAIDLSPELCDLAIKIRKEYLEFVRQNNLRVSYPHSNPITCQSHWTPYSEFSSSSMKQDFVNHLITICQPDLPARELWEIRPHLGQSPRSHIPEFIMFELYFHPTSSVNACALL